MKIVKRLFIALLIVMFILPIGLYIGIVVANNSIADRIEKDLVAYELPENTKLVDSISIVGKLTGNGNGMQYMGSILVKSDLDEEELAEYYSSAFDFIEVRRQEEPNIDFLNTFQYSFDGFAPTDTETYYSITCWDSKRNELFGDVFVTLLDFDIRGH